MCATTMSLRMPGMASPESNGCAAGVVVGVSVSCVALEDIVGVRLVERVSLWRRFLGRYDTSITTKKLFGKMAKTLPKRVPYVATMQ